ncbi:putative serine protease [Burkholderia pseudomallei ABCPW 107]|nr:putative serine protease [Burkholderia pseudomallei ABCPW 107]
MRAPPFFTGDTNQNRFEAHRRGRAVSRAAVDRHPVADESGQQHHPARRAVRVVGVCRRLCEIHPPLISRRPSETPVSDSDPRADDVPRGRLRQRPGRLRRCEGATLRRRPRRQRRSEGARALLQRAQRRHVHLPDVHAVLRVGQSWQVRRVVHVPDGGGAVGQHRHRRELRDPA